MCTLLLLDVTIDNVLHALPKRFVFAHRLLSQSVMYRSSGEMDEQTAPNSAQLLVTVECRPWIKRVAQPITKEVDGIDSQCNCDGWIEH